MVCAVSFERYGRLHHCDPAGLTPRIGDKVLIATDEGPEVAECVWAPEWVSEPTEGLPLLVGLAGPQDLERDDRNRRRKAEARVALKRLVREHGLPMKLSGIDVLDRKNQVTIYFTSPGRVDFRELVRDLARTLGTRIELRQLSPRDEAKIQGGIGGCGRDLCCASFLKDFEPLSIRMAKDQDLPLNPLRITGACGKLLCCLKYEHPLYAEFKETAPAVGETVDTPDGQGRVVAHDVPGDRLVVRLSASGQRSSCSKADACAPRRAYDDKPAPDVS